MSTTTPPASELQAELQSKAATIETMSLEMARLRAQAERLSRSSSSAAAAPDQVTALEDKLERAERAAGAAQRELADLKRNLERASAQAVREGGERASAETKLRALEREAEALRAERDDAAKRADALDRKVATLTTLHREHDARSQALRRDKDKADRDLAEARARLASADEEVLALRKRDARDAGGTDTDHLDELEDEGRARLEARLRALEAENSDLRRGIWHERRKEMQVGPDDAARFTDVDLNSAVSPSGGARKAGGGGGGGGGLGDFFSALTGGGGEAHHGGGGADDGFLEDDDMDFDEDAFRKAQEEDARKRIERIKEVKRALKNWEGWRLDLVESRRGGGEGVGEIFEI